MATDNASGSEYFHERRRSAARALDESVQAQMVCAFSGLSPIALSLAHADWAMHLMASPGRQSQLAVRAFELSVQAWNKAADQSADAAPENWVDHHLPRAVIHRSWLVPMALQRRQRRLQGR